MIRSFESCSERTCPLHPLQLTALDSPSPQQRPEDHSKALAQLVDAD